MIRRPPRSTRTDTLFPYTTLFRSAPVGGWPALASDLAGAVQIESPKPARNCLGDVKHIFLRRQSNAIWLQHGKGNFTDRRAIGPGIEDPATIHVAVTTRSRICKPKASGTVENQIIGCLSRAIIAFLVKASNLDRKSCV